MLDKTKAMQIVLTIKGKRTMNSEQETLSKMENYLLNQDTYDHNKTMAHIETLFSPKLGGTAIYVNKVLKYLKLELKKAHKNKV
jgi:hypothetical protein